VDGAEVFVQRLHQPWFALEIEQPVHGVVRAIDTFGGLPSGDGVDAHQPDIVNLGASDEMLV